MTDNDNVIVQIDVRLLLPIKLADIWTQGIYTSSPSLYMRTKKHWKKEGNRGGPNKEYTRPVRHYVHKEAMEKRAIEVTLLQLLQLYHGC